MIVHKVLWPSVSVSQWQILLHRNTESTSEWHNRRCYENQMLVI